MLFLFDLFRKPLWDRFRRRRWGETLIFSFILLLGIICFLIQLQNWIIPQLTLYQEFVPSRGRVIESRIVETSKDQVVFYRPEVLLEHTVAETTYRLWTFDLGTLRQETGYLVDRRQALESLIPFAVDRVVPCWYRADDPQQAIVLWKTSFRGWFFSILSVSLIALGVVGLAQSFRALNISQERKSALQENGLRSLQSLSGSTTRLDWPTIPDILLINESPGTHLTFRLPLGNRPIFPLAGITLFSFAWIVVAVVILCQSILSPEAEWSDQVIGVLFRGIFVGVGIALMIWVIHQLLLTFSLGPTILEISDHPLYPGRKYRVLLQQSGVLRFQSLVVDVVCEEVARFRQGTDTITSRKDVFRQTLFQRQDFETTAELPLNQEFFLQLPLGAMHSFRQDNNEIVWKMEIFAQMVGWPEIRRDCPIIVRSVRVNDPTLEGGG